jgi:hypothetical protein
MGVPLQGKKIIDSRIWSCFLGCRPKEERVTNDSEEISRAATELALVEMVRLVIAEAFFTSDPAEFKRRMEAFENAAVSGISARNHFPSLDDSTNQRVSEEASALVTRIMASIQHPRDPRSA